MKEINVEQLVEWLGPDGAIAGLECSNVTVSQLCDVAGRCGLTVEKRTRRRDIIIDLVNWDATRIDKTMDELLGMNQKDLRSYFLDRKVSNTELLRLLLKLDIRPASGDKTNLSDFAAREISDVGMYQRVARGSKGM